MYMHGICVKYQSYQLHNSLPWDECVLARYVLINAGIKLEECNKHCIALFIKQVLPRLVRPRGGFVAIAITEDLFWHTNYYSFTKQNFNTFLYQYRDLLSDVQTDRLNWMNLKLCICCCEFLHMELP